MKDTGHRLGSRLTYANVVATIALLFAMSGTAVAASHYLITSTKQIKPSVIAKLHGDRGKTGLRGRVGATGALGATGAAGAPGAQGIPGPKGDTGTTGTTGNTGPAGPVTLLYDDYYTQVGHACTITAGQQAGCQVYCNSAAAPYAVSGGWQQLSTPVPTVEGSHPGGENAAGIPVNWEVDFDNTTGSTEMIDVFGVCSSASSATNLDG